MKYTLSTQAIERVTPSKDETRLCKKLSDGKLTANAVMDTIKQKYGITREASRPESFGKYDVYATSGSMYCYVSMNVFRNHFGIQNADDLKQIEADITTIRQYDLLSTPVIGRFTANHFCSIHRIPVWRCISLS